MHNRSEKGYCALASNDHPINTTQYNKIMYFNIVLALWSRGLRHMALNSYHGCSSFSNSAGRIFYRFIGISPNTASWRMLLAAIPVRGSMSWPHATPVNCSTLTHIKQKADQENSTFGKVHYASLFKIIIHYRYLFTICLKNWMSSYIFYKTMFLAIDFVKHGLLH